MTSTGLTRGNRKLKSKALRRATERVRNARGRFVAKEEQGVRASVCRDEDEMVKRLGPLSPGDVCAIVVSCHQHGVLSLRFRGLELTFQPKVDPSKELALDFDAEPPPSTAAETRARLEETRQRIRELDGATASPPDNLAGIRAEHHETVEDEIEMLMVTDPVAFESAVNGNVEFEDAKPS